MRSRHRVSKRIQTIALVGSYVPRACGIATFTKDLRDALADQMGDRQTMVLALDDLPEGYPYPAEVRFQIDVARSTDYRVAADLLNMHEIDAVMLQHEYGIYGGEDGAYVLDLIERLRMPVITTLHTVLTEPSSGQRRVLEAIAERSDRLVVMSHLAEGILESVYGVGSEKVAYIPHGIPDVPFVDASFYKDQFGVEGRTVLLTFGLLSPGKGIEVAIRAMPRIVERFPDVIYMVLGATHPHILRTQGNAYRQSLERLARDLGVRNHVVFHNRFVNLNELIGYVGSADIYILPYPQKAQITSGTLAYALGAGKAVVSTPFWYAEEMLADGRGRLFPFNDSEKLSEAVIDLLENGSERDAMRKRAYLHTRSSVWPEVARSYLRLAGQVIRERARRPRPVTFYRAEDDPAVLPEPSLAHVRRLTDDTGILQHAVYAVPNRFHGYCTDDNARALIAVLEYYDLYGDESVLELVDTYLAFLHHAFNRDQRRFRNFLSYDRRWLETIGSEDSHGRALQALGVAVEHASNDATLTVATRLFHESLERAEEFHSPRSCAFAAIGIQSYLARFGGDTRARRTRDTLARRILNAFRKFATESWPWCEETVTYDNAKLPHALILVGRESGDGEMLEMGLGALDWLTRVQLTEENVASLIGNRGWYSRSGRRARFDQQPIEVMALTEACAEAFTATGSNVWADRARAFLGWFYGNNDTGSLLVDPQTGGCRDGLHPYGPNLNQGAESTLAWLLSVLTVERIDRVATDGSDGVAPAIAVEEQ